LVAQCRRGPGPYAPFDRALLERHIMSTTYAGVAADITDPSTVETTIPDDGDDADAASVNVSFEYYADWLAYLIHGETFFVGAKTFDDEVIFNDTVEFNNATTFDDDVDINGTLNVDGVTYFNSDVAFADSAVFDGPVTIDATIAGSPSLIGSLSRTTAGRWIYLQAGMVSSDHDETCTNADTFFVAPSLGADRIVTLKSTSPAPPIGTRVRFTRPKGAGAISAHTCTFIDEAAGTLCQFNVSAYAWADFEFSTIFDAGGEWLLVAFGGGVTT
jgi:hypothetical protein